jgi:hypothetical protein
VNLADESNYVKSAEIRWSSGEALPRLEDVDAIDLFSLDHASLLSYTYGLQDDLRVVRLLLSEALAQLHALTRQAARYRLRLASLLDQLRALQQRKASA